LVLSLTGLIMGLTAWSYAARRSSARLLAEARMLLCAAIFAFDLYIAIRGLELIQLMPYR
jgi:hypothetical protein